MEFLFIFCRNYKQIKRISALFSFFSVYKHECLLRMERERMKKASSLRKENLFEHQKRRKKSYLLDGVNHVISSFIWLITYNGIGLHTHKYQILCLVRLRWRPCPILFMQNPGSSQSGIPTTTTKSIAWLSPIVSIMSNKSRNKTKNSFKNTHKPPLF